MRGSAKYRFTRDDGDCFTASPMEAAEILGLKKRTAACIHTYARRGVKLKGYSVERLQPQQRRTYTIAKGDVTHTGLFAGEVARITGLKSNEVSVYAKQGSWANGWRIEQEQKSDIRKLKFQPAAGFRCFECVLHTMEQECRKHPCQKPKGYYVYAN